MVEKYKGVLPPDSIWYKLNQEETLTLLKHLGLLDNLLVEQKVPPDSIDLLSQPGQVAKLEKLLLEAGLEIITLHD